MDSVARNVSDLSASERQLYESVLGQPLQGDQRVIVQLVPVDSADETQPRANEKNNTLKPYELWADMSDEAIAELESAILARSGSRPT